MRFDGYDTQGFYDELFHDDGTPREGAKLLVELLDSLPEGDLGRRQRAAERALLRLGATFTVYGDTQATERIFPFDLVPRPMPGEEFKRVEAGLKQRIQALNLFLDDVYNEGKILDDGVVPTELVRGAAAYRQQCVGLKPPHGIWCHITGTDLVRDGEGDLYVLEDNIRNPSGVSYVLENRQVMKQTFPHVFSASKVRPVVDYPLRLLEMLQGMTPGSGGSGAGGAAKVVVLTPGIYNSAYYEHSFLARQMGVELVEGRDLVVTGGRVCMRTTAGFEPVDVIYRRIDDDFLDPHAFRQDSMLGVPGLMEVYRHGGVTLVNAPGTGIADDKVIYAYVPAIIKYYLDQDPILPNVPTYLCWREEDRKYVLEHIAELVVKPANESGGYGMIVGPHATAQECEAFKGRIIDDPRNYIAQPTLNLSRMPVNIDGTFQGRHVDLRPFILYGQDMYVLPGGLTRVALRKGSLVVNSSQGGGSKDTWVLAEEGEQAVDEYETTQLQSQG